MSARPGFSVNVTEPADGGESPNRYMPWITAEIRCFWPPKATDAQVLDALQQAHEKALRKYHDLRHDNTSPTA